MTAEIWSLFGCGILLAISITIQAVHLDIFAGLKHTTGNRDTEPVKLNPLGKRLSSNVTNMIEGMAMFVPLVIIVEFAEVHSNLTSKGAIIFFLSRVLYMGCYIFGIRVFRSIFWIIGMGALSAISLGIILSAL